MPDAAEPVRVVIVADDLIWATRLADAVRTAGAVPVRVRRLEDLFAALDGARHVVVDLTARAYDGPRVVAEAAARARVLAIGQHDDLELRKAALAAGAERVLAYRKVADDGAGIVRAWLESADQPTRTAPPRA